MNKERYIQLIDKHRVILEKSRNLIENIFDRIQEDIEKIPSEAPVKNIEYYEDAATIVNKLSSILLKIIKQEQEIALIDIEKLNEANLSKTDLNAPITKEDIEMMEQYLEIYREQQSNSPSPLYRAEAQAKADAGEGWGEG